MEPLVSVIIPVYNAGGHLARCIESVRRQTYQNLQVVLVNDGSTDSSAEVCRMYARVDGRIRLIDKPNAGVSAARNDGLAAAKGEYIQFVDSDDYLPEDATALLVDRARETECDLVIGAYFRVVEGAVPGPHGDGGTRYTLHGFLPRGPVLDKTAFARRLLDEPASYYYGVLWNKLYRAALIRDNGIRFAGDLNWSEDFLFNLEYIRYAEKFAALDRPVYYYVKNESSITHTQLDIANVLKTKAVLFTYYKDLYEKLGLYDACKAQVYKYLIATAEHS